MLFAGDEHHTADGASWSIARPVRPGTAIGLSMAGFRSRAAGPIEMPVVPHPAVTLVADFGASSMVVDDGMGPRQLGGLVAGLRSGGVRLRGNDIACLEVRLSPLIVRAVLGICPAELDRTVLSLDDLWGRESARLREQLGESSSWEDRFALADTVLARRGENGPAPDPEVVWAWKRIIRSRGRIRVEELAVELGWSRKRLWTRFRDQVGLPPKRAASLVRFDRAAHHLAAGRDVARVAADCGYVDQSHLHREVVAFTGMTPVALAGDPDFAADHLAYAR
ncbi:helix-turn-helix domain-containing protein [Nocardia sp. CDC153]|uniref:helix-turn-helix domain-containing protein n=1 Tax=Nocardia sp. CDC153 TaxID=3112167 RepID=UPI002DB7FDCD|nr:helix-turn-helix domain-containing protein [Nocardia sp. CDC153]MEC3957167.1 helix-turn-helix domain-containing protein [Nocardia sp. CDC153]